MIKYILFDCDGIVIEHEMYFSKRYPKDFGVPEEKIVPFFKKEFQGCIVGQADLKVELQKYLEDWEWDKSVEELMQYWFEFESRKNSLILQSVRDLRAKGVQCFIHTNNEKYRVQYLLEECELTKDFDGVFASGLLGVKKPDQKFWQVVWEKLGKPNKTEVFMWDDNQENVASAKEFGFQAELYRNFEEYSKKIATFL